MHTAKILRSVGQSIFLLINLFLAIFLYLSIRQDRSNSGTIPYAWTKFFRVKRDHGAIDASNREISSEINPTVRVLIIAWPPLIIRGIFGLLQGLVDPINYSHPAAYEYENGNLSFGKTFIVMENIFSVLPEWLACCLLVSTMFTKEGNHKLHVEMRERANSEVTAAETPQGEAPERKVSTV